MTPPPNLRKIAKHLELAKGKLRSIEDDLPMTKHQRDAYSEAQHQLDAASQQVHEVINWLYPVTREI